MFERGYNYSSGGSVGSLEDSKLKQVYEPESKRDRSGFLNLQLLYHHFPKEVNITGVVIFRRILVADGPSRYNAIVYTEGQTLEDSFEFYLISKSYYRETAERYDDICETSPQRIS